LIYSNTKLHRKKTHKSTFHNFFFDKQIKNPVRPFLTFISTKHTKNRIRHNLVSESEQVSLELRVFWFVCCKFRSSKPRKWFYMFLICFSLQILIIY